LRPVQRVQFVTLARATFTDVRCVFADLAAATVMAACLFHTLNTVLRHRKSCCDLMATIMLKGLLSLFLAITTITAR